MIDINNQVFTLVAKELRAKHKGILVTGEYSDIPSKFPCVVLEEKDNRTYIHTLTNKVGENHALVMYEVNIFSDKQGHKKTECRNILVTLDEKMQELGFIRIMATPIPNMKPNIYRMVARYRATVSKDNIIYRRY